TLTIRMQERTAALPDGLQPVLPATQKKPCCQIELRKRSSLVLIVPPGCIAGSGTEVAGMARSVRVMTTLLLAGVPVIASTPAKVVPLKVTYSVVVELND